MAEVDDGFVEVGGGDAWSPKEVGDNVTGVFVSTKEGVGPHSSQLHNLRTDDGMVGVWGSTVLDDKFLDVKAGDTVRVTYTGLGKATPGKQPFKTWKLEVKPGSTPAGVPKVETVDATLDADGEIDLSKLPY